MVITPFRDRIVLPGNAPPWLRDGTGGRLLYTFGAMIDARLERLVQGVMMRMPRADLPGGSTYQAPHDALQLIADMRSLTQGPTESDAGFAVRLQGAASEWQIWGSPRALMDQVAAYFTPFQLTLRVVSDSGHWWTRGPDGSFTVLAPSARPPAIASNWNWDGNARWWRSWLIVYLPAGFTSATTYNYDGPAHYDGAPVYDGMTTQTALDIYNIAAAWMPEHAVTGGAPIAGVIFTSLQPTDVIPSSSPAAHPFDPGSTSQTISTYTTLPTGHWGSPVYTSGPNIGLPTRPPWALFYNINNGP